MAVSHIKSNTVPDFTGTVTGFNSQGLTTTYAASALVRPSDWNSVHNFYQTISGNTSGSSTASGTNLVFGFSNDVTGSLQTAAGAATLWVNGGAPLRGWNNEVSLQNTGYLIMGASNWFMQPLLLQRAVSLDYLRIPVLNSTVGTTTHNATVANTSYTASHGITFRVGIYTKGTGASSGALMSFVSSQGVIQNRRTYTAGATGSRYTVMNAFTVPYLNNTSGFSTSVATSFTALRPPPDLGMSSVTGNRFIDVPLATILPASNYWIAVNITSTGGPGGSANFMQSRLELNPIIAGQEDLAFAYLGETSTGFDAKNNPGLGLFGSSALANSVHITNIASFFGLPFYPVTFGVT